MQILTKDKDGNVYVMFVRDDNVAVVYQGEFSSFTTDGSFAHDFSAFNLELKGFLRFDGLKSSIEEAVNDVCKETPIDPSEPIDPIKPIEPPIDPSTPINLYPIIRPYQNSRFIPEALDWDRVLTNPVSVNGMKGYDFAPIQANQGQDKWTYKEWNQTYTTILGETEEGYFVSPKGYETDLSHNLMDFDLKFPDFSLPKGKIVVMQPTPTREIGKSNYLKKGVTYVKTEKDLRGYIFVSDGWLIEMGCPPAYTATQEEFDNWCRKVDSDALLNSFIRNVYLPFKDIGYVMLNWEHVGHRWNVRKDKIIRCLEYWRNSPHNAKMALWTVSGIGIGRPKFQGLGIDFTPLLEFDGTLDQFQKKFSEYVSVDFSYAQYVEIGHIGGYMNYPIEEGVIHHYLTEALLHRKYNDKKVLATIWFDQELINNFNLERVAIQGDITYYAQVKPKVFPSTAFNWGVWTLVFDGFDCWSDPNYWTDEKKYYGWGAIDENGKELPEYYDKFGSKYPSQPMKAIDWMMRGVWAMSENKDIIESKSEWIFPVLPTKSFYDKSPLIAYKIKGNEALILVLNTFGGHDEIKEINILNHTIKTFGRFTSVKRIKLK